MKRLSLDRFIDISKGGTDGGTRPLDFWVGDGNANVPYILACYDGFNRTACITVCNGVANQVFKLNC